MLEDDRRRQAEAQSDHEPPAAVWDLDAERELAVAVTFLDPLAGKTVHFSFNEKREPIFDRELANAYRL